MAVEWALVMDLKQLNQSMPRNQPAHDQLKEDMGMGMVEQNGNVRVKIDTWVLGKLSSIGILLNGSMSFLAFIFLLYYMMDMIAMVMAMIMVVTGYWAERYLHLHCPSLLFLQSLLLCRNTIIIVIFIVIIEIIHHVIE